MMSTENPEIQKHNKHLTEKPMIRHDRIVHIIVL